MKSIFVDTSGWFSLVDQADPHFEASSRFFRSNKLPLVTTDFVFSESITLIRYRLGHGKAASFGDHLLASSSILHYKVEMADEKEAWEYFKKFSDKDYSFTDCLSFVVMMKLKINNAFTHDKHFTQAGFMTLP